MKPTMEELEHEEKVLMELVPIRAERISGGLPKPKPPSASSNPSEDVPVVTKEAIEKVLDEIDKGIQPVPKNRRSTNWCLYARERHYPPKYVFWRARKILGLRGRHFRGGEGLNTHLRRLGYDVMPDNCGGTCNFSD